MRGARLAGALGLALLGSCTVDRSALDEEVFGCRRDSECTEGYGCQLVGALGDGFCVPIASDPGDCDGFVTASGLCLTECVPGADRCDRELECVSNDVELSGTGYCAPVDTCSRDAECGGDDACLSTVIHDFTRALWGPHEFPRAEELSCVPRCGEGGECPEGTDCLAAFVVGLEYCLPRCGEDAACPLGFACYATPGTSIGICIPGVTGLECRDDASCLTGRCETFVGEDEAEFNVCVAPCDGGVAAPPCTDATIVDGALNVYQCTAVPGIGEYCLFRGGYLHSCDPARPGDCVDGLSCEQVPAEGGGTAPACVRSCVPDFAAPNQDQNGDCTDNAFCYPGSQVAPPFIDTCIFDLRDGSGCLFDDQCESGACHLELSCGQDEGVGCCGPP